MTTTSTLSPSSRTLLATWKRTDRKFFRKYARDASAMEVIAALAELIATYETISQKSTPFYC